MLTKNDEDGEDDDETLLRSLIRPEEDHRRLHPELPWRGGYRWFRSANVIPGSELSRGGGLKAMLPDIRHPNRSTAAASVSCGPGSRQVESAAPELAPPACPPESERSRRFRLGSDPVLAGS